MTDIMKLADDYAECMYLRREKHEARSALQSAIEALQGENERLKQDRDEWRDSTIAANQNAASEEKRRREMQDQRDALAAKLDELQRQEPVGFVAPHDMKTLREGYPATVVMLSGAKRTVPLYAAPKALEPLTDEQSATLFQAVKDDPRSAKFSVRNWFTCGLVTAEAAHGITKGTPT